MKPSVGTWLGQAPMKVCVGPQPCQRKALQQMRSQLDEVLQSLPARSIAPPAGAEYGAAADCVMNQRREHAVAAEADPKDSAAVSTSSPVCSTRESSCGDAVICTLLLPPNESALSPVCSKTDTTSSDDAMLPPNDILPASVWPKSEAISFDDAMFRTTPLPVNETAPCALAATTSGIAPCSGIAPPAGAFGGIAPPAAHGIAPPAGQFA